MKKIMNQSIIVTLLALGVIGCGSGGSDSDVDLQKLITSNQLTGDVLKGKAIPKITDAKSQLGMNLFFSKSLGADRDSACVTCHHPMLGGGDNLSLPIGTGAMKPSLLGEGRLHNVSAPHHDGGPTVPRNAPTTFNMLGWKHALFHDGRIEHVMGQQHGISTPDSGHNIVDPLATAHLASAQSRFPIVSPEEMKGFNHDDKDNQATREYVAGRIGGYGEAKDELADTDYWLKQFQKAFGKPNGKAEELITEQNIAMLLGEYENSQAFTNNPWKAYVNGNKGAISQSAKEGALLFFTPISEGGADCVHCHKGDLFSDESFHNTAMPQIGRSPGHGSDGIEDFGRSGVTEDDKDKYKFRTPSLLNVEVTGPWGHDGAYTSLEAIVKHMSNPKEAIKSYDLKQLTQTGIQNLDKMAINSNKAVGKLEKDRVAGLDVLQNSNLSDSEIEDVVNFLRTLTDPCVVDESCLKQWIPKVALDPNGDQLDAVDNKGNILGLK